MNFTVSNTSVGASLASVTSALSAAEPATAETAPVQPEITQAVIALLAVGTCLAIVWLVRRIIYPRKLSLSRAPGRPNKLNAAQGLVLLIVLMMVGIAAMALLQSMGLDKARAMVLAVTLDRLVWLAVLLPIGALGFRFGLVRGMGLSVRHWLYDTIRAVYAYLAIFPVCFALQAIVILLMPNKWHLEHPMLTAMDDLSQSWQVMLAISAVVLVPVSEEVFFRGILQSIARKHLGNAWAAVLATSAIFAILHHATPQSIPSLFALSMVLGYTYERSGRLFSPILIHVIFNGVSVTLFFMQMS